MHALLAAGKLNLESDWSVVEQALDPGSFILGDRFSAVDLYFVMFPDWHSDRDGLLARYRNIARVCEHVPARPAVAGIDGEYASN